MRSVRKPHWLKRSTWDALLAREAPLPKCVDCGTIDDLTVDHLKSRFDGGTDDLDNLQFMCRFHNSLKGVRPDSYWNQEFYWDRRPSDIALLKLREAQRRLMEEITTNPYFTLSLSEIARRLYICGWVVAAGKTIAIPVAAWALNLAIRAARGNVRRVDRILVCCKDSGIRDQIATDLPNDLYNLGIVNVPPRVGIVTDGSQWTQHTWIDQHDIIVTCSQHFWTRKQDADIGAARSGLAATLARFPLIAMDEPHFAEVQSLTIVDQASCSVSIGFTSTPFDRVGALLQRMIALSIYGYRDADKHDRSLKYLTNEKDQFDRLVREIKINEAFGQKGGKSVNVFRPDELDGYEYNLRPAISVVGGVIEELMTRDELQLGFETLAQHRDQPDVEMSVLYPAHAIIYVDSIPIAEELARIYNRKFAAEPFIYRPEQGWQVAVVHSGGHDGDQVIAARPLARSPQQSAHPWMHCYRSGGKVDHNAARILICVDMAREGINNPYCTVTGVAGNTKSLVTAVQAWLGRQLRAVCYWKDDKFQVPPEILDQVRIITHEAYDAKATMRKAIDFVCRMDEYLEALPTINDLEDGEPVEVKPNDRDLMVPRKDKLDILAWVGEQQTSGTSPTPIEAVQIFAPEGGRRGDFVAEWVQTCIKAKGPELRKELALDKGIETIDTVMREDLRHEPSDVDLERYIRAHEPSLIPDLPLNEQARRFAVRLFLRHANEFHPPLLTPTTTINALARNLGGLARRDLGRHCTAVDGKIFALGVKAVKLKLGIPARMRLGDKTDFNTPETHAIIRNPNTQVELARWLIRKLIDDGDCPSLQVLRT